MAIAWTTTEAILAVVRSRTGLHTSVARRADAEAAIRRAMERTGISDPTRMLMCLEESTTAMDDLLAELTVGESYFFRVAEHFDFIREVVVPEVRRRRGGNHLLSVWSAGCARGEEPYSLAITFDEMQVGARIVATDICRASLERAREAVYRPWAIRGLDEDRRRRWFRRLDERAWRLDPSLASSVVLLQHSLLDERRPWTGDLQRHDLILCRNVLIYFDVAGVAEAAERLHDGLAPGGWLLTGPSDPSLADHAPFDVVTTDAGVFYRRLRDLCSPLSSSRWPSPPGPLPARASAEPARRSKAEDPGTAPRRAAIARTGRIDHARRALSAGEYQRAWALTRDPSDDQEAIVHIRAAASFMPPSAALKAARDMAQRFPLCAGVHLLEAAMLTADHRDREAIVALRRAVYLDASIALAHLMLGEALRRLGRVPEAAKAFATAANVARSRPPKELVAFGDGHCAGALVKEADRRRRQAEREAQPS